MKNGVDCDKKSSMILYGYAQRPEMGLEVHA